MSYIDKIDKILDTVVFGDVELNLGITDTRVTPKRDTWSITLDGDDFYSRNVKYYAKRTLDAAKSKWMINRNEVISSIENRVHSRARTLFTHVSPAKAPKRTKIYKSFCTVLEKNKGKIEFMNSLFDIAEYRYSVTSTESILSKTNDVHRTNIYQLLCLMEKRYGQEKT